MSEDIKEIAAALSKFQGVMPILRKTGTNFTKGNAATIGDIVTVAKQGSQFGLSYTQRVDFIGDEPSFVESIMMHTSGQSLSSGKYKVMPIKPNDPSSFGAAVTFAKKNSLMALFGIADHDGEDHDWNLDEQGNLRPEHRPDPAPTPIKPAARNEGSALLPSNAAAGQAASPSVSPSASEAAATIEPTLKKLSDAGTVKTPAEEYLENLQAKTKAAGSYDEVVQIITTAVNAAKTLDGVEQMFRFLQPSSEQIIKIFASKKHELVQQLAKEQSA